MTRKSARSLATWRCKWLDNLNHESGVSATRGVVRMNMIGEAELDLLDMDRDMEQIYPRDE